ncbi:MAG: endolytic transglycosylase MltG [Alphaproteobacteria bacterium]|nr:MAG: endolytic transglycosylase MltG [Alphaproteobacteria bacterium]
MSGRRGFVLGLLLALAAALALLAGLVYHMFTGPGPLTETRTVIIERGEKLAAIARKLDALGALRDPRLFRLAARLSGADRTLRAGEFRIPPHASVMTLIEVLRKGEPVLRRVTVPEGLTSAQVVALLEATEGLVGHVDKVPPEGTLLPETYYFTYGDSRQALLRRMEKAQSVLLAALWPARAPGLPFHSSDEAVILASIVEKETGRDDERPLIAAVFLNRLRRGMPLQSDPTVIYGISGGEPLGRGIRQSELDADNPFNTYRLVGLPPAPISNPGRASIEAVLHPTETDYLYFVADGSGGHVFAKTLAEHNRNVAAWRRLRLKRANPSSETGAGPDR